MKLPPEEELEDPDELPDELEEPEPDELLEPLPDELEDPSQSYVSSWTLYFIWTHQMGSPFSSSH